MNILLVSLSPQLVTAAMFYNIGRNFQQLFMKIVSQNVLNQRLGERKYWSEKVMTDAAIKVVNKVVNKPTVACAGGWGRVTFVCFYTTYHLPVLSAFTA